MNGRDEAFREFVSIRSASLLRTAFLLTGDHGLAEDLLQTALLKTYRHWRRLDNPHDPAAFVRRVMVTTNISWLRRRQSTERVLDVLPDRPAPDEHEAVGEREQVWRALRTLPPRMRAVIVLRFYEDLSEAETARLLDCSLGTVKSQSSRGLVRLRESLSHGHHDAAEPSSERGAQ
ncbi:MAG: SigE family RNA polymerase sigma factor [Geodermatophilaceae bacterium]|nr:SigE family RNA polymerase sigma factor [Geodermatophilaceae bacterium]